MAMDTSGHDDSEPLIPLGRCLVAVLVGIVVISTTPPSHSAAFDLHPHERITRDALGGQLDPVALDVVVGSFLGSTGVRGADRDFFGVAQHYDSAPNAEDIEIPAPGGGCVS
jgi:hypothetical protein